ncbi:hypothetical protein FRC07_002618 [Ceratobasidium sp. 392]|nr:hypothetical protein FRC07_002618 [Ceratobasidium sp. 392]
MATRNHRTKIEINTSDLNISLATLSLYICGYGLVSYVVKHRLYLSEPLVALLFGIIIGPAVLEWVNPNLWKPREDQLMGYKDSLTLALTRLTIGIQVFFAGVTLPKKYLKTEFQSLIVLLLPIMTIAWFVCGFLIYELIPGLTFMEALLISACITPTDPILANSIVKGRYADRSVDPSVRNIILAESGANDGLGYPFVFLRLLIGWVARKSLRWCEKEQMLDEDNFVAYGTGLSFFCLGFLGIIGSDDLLCCFIAGNSFSWDDRQRIAAEDAGFQDIIDMLLNAAIFMYIGAIMPWYAYNDVVTGMIPWRIVTLAICVMVFRRLPWVAAIYKLIPAIPSFKEAVFVGWFGPIGVSAIFYVQIILEYLPKDSREQVKLTVEPVVYFMVFTSILVHGVTVPAIKVATHGATLTRTLTQTSTTVKTKPQAPINLSSIRRVGVAVPVPAYNIATGERVTRSVELDSRRMSSESWTRSHANAGSPRPSVARQERERSASPLPDAEGRTVT